MVGHKGEALFLFLGLIQLSHYTKEQSRIIDYDVTLQNNPSIFVSKIINNFIKINFFRNVMFYR